MQFIANLFWLTDVIFFIGMGLALNSTQLSNFLGQLFITIIQKYVRKGEVPQHLLRQIEKNKQKYAYHIIRAVLSVAFAGNLIYHGYAASKHGENGAPGRRNMVLNFMYLVYPLLTIQVSAKDILLHDDRKKWPDHVKRKHVIFPVNFDDNKVFKKDLERNNYVQQMVQISKSTLSTATDFARFGLVYYLIHTAIPWTRLFLPPFALFVHNKFNLLFNNLFDMFTMKAFQNRYEHYFGNMWKIYDPANGGDKHDQLGRQYQYFFYSFKPLERVLKKQVFDKLRKKSFSVKEAKAATIMARGLVVTMTLLSFSMLQTDYSMFDDNKGKVIERCLLAVSRPLLYYAIHATYAYYQPIPSKKTKLPFVRTVLSAGESVLAGYLFYQPIIKRCVPVLY